MAEPDYLKLVQEMRKEFKKGDDQRDADLPTQIPEVERFDNVPYGQDQQYQLLDVYLPQKEQMLNCQLLSISMVVAGYMALRKLTSFIA